MELDHNEAKAIIAELQRMHAETLSLIDDANSDPSVLKTRLATLKQDIKEAAKNETLSRRKAAKTELEQAFFGPAMRATSANFRIRTDTSPQSPAWASGLREVEHELSYFLHGIESFVSKQQA